MHSSIASSSSEEQQTELIQLAARQLPRSALPSLASLRMHTPLSYGEVASSSAAGVQQTSFGVPSGRASSVSSSASTSTLSSRGGNINSSNGNNGFWKNPILYKTTICDNWAAKKPCKYGARCWYAHGFNELRYVPRLDQLPENVREALFVEPALARAFFQEMTSSIDGGYASGSSSRECESRASLVSMTSSSSSSVADSCRLSMSPTSASESISPPMNEMKRQMYSPPVAATTSYFDDRRASRWAPGAAWTDGGETPRASRVNTTVPSETTVSETTVPVAKSRMTSKEYRLFDSAHPLTIDLSFLD